MRHLRGAACAQLALLAIAAPALAAPEGQLTWGVHVSLAPTWFDPAETQGIITPFMIMYATHNTMVKAMPGNQESGLGLIPGHALRGREAQGEVTKGGSMLNPGDKAPDFPPVGVVIDGDGKIKEWHARVDARAWPAEVVKTR